MPISNKEMRPYVEATRQFTNHNQTVWTTWEGKLYVVYSYGRHFPMYAYDTESERWFGNKDKFSRTTTTHQRLAQPRAEIDWMNTETIKSLLEARSIKQFVINQLNRG